MKKATAILCAVALAVCLCACGNTPEPPAETEAPTEAPAPQSPSDAEETGFRLDHLPDIGGYRGAGTKYYYGEPLNEFRTSEDYGTVVPYVMRQKKVGDAPDVLSCGFMTADGRIITGPIYDRIRSVAAGDGMLYRAELKLLAPEPRIPSYREGMTEAEWEAYYKAYHQAEMHVIENRVCQFISADGSRCGSFSGSAEVFTDESSGKTVITCDGYSGGSRTLKIYDADFNLMIDLTQPLQWFLKDYSFFGGDANYYSLIGADDTGVAVAVNYYEKEGDYGGRVRTKLYLTEGDSVDSVVDLGDVFPRAFFGDLIVTDNALIDLEGTPRYTAADNGRILFAPAMDRVFFSDPAKGSLTCMDRSGRQTVLDAMQADELRMDQVKGDDGAPYLLVKGTMGENVSYVVFDGSLREVYRIPYRATAGVYDAIDYYRRTGAIILSGNGTGELRGWTGELLAELPAEIDRYPYFYDGVLVLGDSADRHFLYYPGGRSVKELPQMSGTFETVFCDENMYELCTYGENWTPEYTLYDTATDAPVCRSLQAFLPTKVGGKTYYAYVDGGAAWVRDGEGNILMKTYDGAMA